MNQVHQTSDNNGIAPATGAQSQLEKLKSDLLAKRESSVQKGLVEDINMIDKALDQVETALQSANIDQKITNSQVRLGQIRSPQMQANAVEESPVISAKEAEQIKAIKSVQGQALEPGQVFASMSGREPSNVDYMKKNIGGLFDLVALKG